MKKYILAAMVLAVAGAAFADPIADRKAAMKTHGRAMGTIAPIVKGEKPFDAAVVLAALQELNASAESLDIAVLWPEGSGVGDTKSSPKIWEDAAGFMTAVDKFKADTAAAVAAAPQDLDTLKVQFGMVGANCGSCHQAFRM